MGQPARLRTRAARPDSMLRSRDPSGDPWPRPADVPRSPLLGHAAPVSGLHERSSCRRTEPRASARGPATGQLPHSDRRRPRGCRAPAPSNPSIAGLRRHPRSASRAVRSPPHSRNRPTSCVAEIFADSGAELASGRGWGRHPAPAALPPRHFDGVIAAGRRGRLPVVHRARRGGRTATRRRRVLAGSSRLRDPPKIQA